MPKKIDKKNIGDNKPLVKEFSDSLVYDSKNKTAISVRDGVQEYYGIEIGEIPEDKIFTVYRSPATIANTVKMLDALPLTNEHVTLDSPPHEPVGSIIDSILIDSFDESLGSTMAIKNTVTLSDSILSALESGKRELSLGYKANLKPHNKYDFEQTEIEPHHLAVVDRGRCGAICAFTDKLPKGDIMKHKLFDAEGSPNLEEIVQIATSLPEAIKKLDMEQLNQVMPMLEEIVSVIKAEQAPAEEQEEGESMDEEAEKKPVEATDEEEEEGKKPEMTDSKAFKDAINTAVQSALELHTSVIEKAKSFVDEQYSFTGKKTCKIMRDALKVEHGNQKFSDDELKIAFKLLKKSQSSLANFGDSKPQSNPYLTTGEKEL